MDLMAYLLAFSDTVVRILYGMISKWGREARARGGGRDDRSAGYGLIVAKPRRLSMDDTSCS
jgi:hypothetical protein